MTNGISRAFEDKVSIAVQNTTELVDYCGHLVVKIDASDEVYGSGSYEDQVDGRLEMIKRAGGLALIFGAATVYLCLAAHHFPLSAISALPIAGAVMLGGGTLVNMKELALQLLALEEEKQKFLEN